MSTRGGGGEAMVCGGGNHNDVYCAHNSAHDDEPLMGTFEELMASAAEYPPSTFQSALRDHRQRVGAAEEELRVRHSDPHGYNQLLSGAPENAVLPLSSSQELLPKGAGSGHRPSAAAIAMDDTERVTRFEERIICQWCAKFCNPSHLSACPQRWVRCHLCHTLQRAPHYPSHFAQCEAYVLAETTRRVAVRLEEEEDHRRKEEERRKLRLRMELEARRREEEERQQAEAEALRKKQSFFQKLLTKSAPKSPPKKKSSGEGLGDRRKTSPALTRFQQPEGSPTSPAVSIYPLSPAALQRSVGEPSRAKSPTVSRAASVRSSVQPTSISGPPQSQRSTGLREHRSRSPGTETYTSAAQSQQASRPTAAAAAPGPGGGKRCAWCKKRYPEAEHAPHEKHCPLKKLLCSRCGEKIYRKDRTSHSQACIGGGGDGPQS